MILSSPSYAGFWDFLKRDKAASDVPTQVEEAKPEEGDKAAPVAEVEKPVEVVEPATTKVDAPAAETTKAAEDAKQAEAAKAAETAKAAEVAKQAEAAKAAETAKATEIAKQAEAAKAAETAKAAEVAKQAEAVKATETAKATEIAKQAEAAKAAETAKATEIAKQAEAAKAAETAKATEIAKQAEAAKAAETAKATEIAKQTEAAKATETAKAAEIAKQAEAAKSAETAKAAEIAKQAEAAKSAETAKAAEIAKQAEAAKAAETAKAAAVAKQAEAAKAIETAKAAEVAKQAEAAKVAEAAKAAEIAKAEAEQAAATTQVAAPVSSGKSTPMGAEMAGNADGSIPAWTGKMNGAPAGLRYLRSGDSYPDPYAKEQPLFTIHAGNMDQYANKMSEGTKALMKKFPDSFVMNIYKTHRDAKIDDLIVQRTTWNAAKTKLVGLDGLVNYTGGVPFSHPKSGAEVMWNARVSHPHPTIVGTMDDMAVYLNGNNQMRRQVMVAEFPFSYKSNELGKVDDAIGINAAYVHVTIEKPDRQKGQMTIIHEALDQVKGERKAWVYIPGSRRVRRAPTVGFDTPDGPGGLVTVDDSLGFNGAMVRYNWSLVGKKEIYIPYHNYKFDDSTVTYATLLQEGHANPDYMRYELHRVWIVEATLKQGQRHVYAKRRFYVDEDSWQFALVESYDGRGYLWRVGILNTLYDYLLKAYIARAQVFHDLQSGAYVAQRLVNETKQPNLMANPRGEKFYTPANLKTMGK